MIQEKLPPHSQEAEEAVLGSILINPESYDIVSAIISSGDFYYEKHKWIFEAMQDIAPAIDQITVTGELDRLGHLQAIGGPAKLSELVANTPTSVHAEYYAQMIAEHAYQRRLIATSGEIARLAYSGESGPEEISAKAHQLLADLNPPGKHTIIKPREHAETMLAMLNDRKEKIFDAIPFGYLDLDRALGGLYPGDLVIVGARPSIGKSQLLLEIAHNAAGIGKSTLFAAVEMSLKQVSEREVSMGTGMPIKQLRQGLITDDEMGRILNVVGHVSDIPLYFLCGKCSVGTIKQRATVLKQTTGLNLVIVDYLQLLKDKNDKSMGKDLRERVGYISGELKNLAMELEVCVVVASQFSRDVEYRADHRPRLSDLRESGDLEQDADVVLLLHRPEVYYGYDPKDKGLLYIGPAKIRQGGSTGEEIKLVWKADEFRYRDALK